MGSRRSSTAGLAGFLVELDRRLDSLGTGGVRAALRAAATRLTPSERPAFLALFDDDTAVDPPDDDLLEEIDTFVVGFPAAIEDRIEQRWRDQHGRGDWWDDDEESLGSDEVDELYLRLGDRFLAGDWAVATAGYRRLLHAAADDVDSPDGHIVGGSPEVVREALARLMRAVLADASTSPAERAAAAVDALEDHASTAGCPSLAEILGSHPAPVVDVDEVLVALG